MAVDGQVKALAGTIGENIVLRRTATLHVSPGRGRKLCAQSSGSRPRARLGVLVALKSSGNAEKLAALGRQLAMHIAGRRPRRSR